MNAHEVQMLIGNVSCIIDPAGTASEVNAMAGILHYAVKNGGDLDEAIKTFHAHEQDDPCGEVVLEILEEIINEGRGA